MRRTLIVLFVSVFIVVSSGIVPAADKSHVYYVCNCKPDCNCNSISKEPGKCKCGTEMVPMHLLAIEGDTAILCTCGADCTCKRSADDPNKCGCGKPVKKVNLKGKYVCGCGPDCKCSAISDNPGKCGCGKEMKKI